MGWLVEPKKSPTGIGVYVSDTAKELWLATPCCGHRFKHKDMRWYCTSCEIDHTTLAMDKCNASLEIVVQLEELTGASTRIYEQWIGRALTDRDWKPGYQDVWVTITV